MKITFLANLIGSRKCRRIRVLMRGYRILKDNNQLGWVRRIKRDLADTQIGAINPAASRHFFGAGTGNAVQIIQQYALTRIGGDSLNKALLHSIGSNNRPVTYPLPKEFQSALSKNGFIVSRWSCSALWAGYVCLLWCYGVLSIARHLYDALCYIARPIVAPMEPFAFFVRLASNNLPQRCKDGRSHDIITWYANWQGADPSLTTLRHDVRGSRPTVVSGKRVEFVEHSVPPLSSIASLLRFVRWATLALLRSAIDACRGRWWHALLLAESAKAALVRLADPHQLAREYLFHFSGTIYRPIWTYEAIEKGSQITCYFYSTSEEFKLPTGYEPNSSYWKVTNWPRYLVWDLYQEDLLRSSVGQRANVQIAGPIWFNSSAKEMSEVPPNSVAVFDIQPFRVSAHFGFSTMAEYGFGHPNVPIAFIQDSYSAVFEHGGTLVHKRKRHDGRRFQKSYRSTIEKLSNREGFIALDPDTAAIRVIEQCRAVISMPFTSTAILGRHLGKPSVYYDPTGRLQRDDKGAHGIPILSGKDELKEWISVVMGEQSLDNRSDHPALPCNVAQVQRSVHRF